MKKWLTWLLAGALLLPLAACSKTPPGEDSSASVSAVESENSEGEQTPMRYTLISVGKPYTSKVASNEHYVDCYEQQLTDGQKTPDSGVFYTDPRMVGYTSNNLFVIDLGEDGKRINAVAARSLDLSQDGVRLSGGVRFHGSTDGENWKSLGRAYFTPTGDRTVSTARLELEEPMDYRYIRVTMNLASGAAFFFLDELEVYADVPEKEPMVTLDAAYAGQKIDRGAWKALSTGAAAEPVASVNVARGASYSYANLKFDPRAQDGEGKLLTDGATTGKLFGEAVWAGLKASSAPSITVKLSEERSDLYAFRVYALNNAPQVRFADWIDVYGSTDNKSFTLLGRMYAPDGGNNHTYTLLLPEYVKAKYIRFSFPAGSEEDFYWIEEIQVAAGSEEEIPGELFPPFTIGKVTEEVLWPATDADYRKQQNLLLGLPQKIASSDYRDLASHGDETGADTTLLTDGKLAKDLYCYNGEFFFSRGGNALEFFYDLGALSTVQEFHIRYLEHGEWGIANPRWVTVLLSEDAENWYPVSYYTGGEWDSAQAAVRKSIDWTLEQPYAARFVRFRIESAALFLEELEVIGTKAVSSSAVRLADSGIDSVPYYLCDENRAYASTENTPIKAKDIAIVYGNHDNGEMLLPLVAYLDENGKIQDTLMDGFLYCTSGILPSGSQLHLPNYKVDWEYLYDITFNGAVGLDKLEKTVAQVKAELNRPDYVVQIYIMMPTVVKTVTDFGDVDGDGVSESLATPEGRKKVVDWYINMFRDEFAARGYQHMEIGGFYWSNEAVTWGAEADDSDIIREVASYVHENGEYLLWIPYHDANRYFLTYELGFDLICMQPNYMFSTDKPLSNFTHTANVGLDRKMCVEIEHSYQAFSDPVYVRNYMLYLYYGATMGYMKDAIHIYYDDYDNLSRLAISDDPLCRLQYDATYQFIRGTLDITPDARSASLFSGKQDTILRGTVGVETWKESYTLVRAPEHGIVTMQKDGSFLYFPDPGYTGTDSFSYTYNAYLGESAPCQVELQIG